MAPQITLAISVIALLTMAGIFGYYLLRKLFFSFKWRSAKTELKAIKEAAEKIKSGNMIDGTAFEKVQSKKDTFIDQNTLQREKDVNYAYQNINYRNKLLKDIFSGYKALDKFAGQKTISALKSKKTSEIYPTKPENDIDKSKIKSKDAKNYLQERNVIYTYTPDISLLEKILWLATLVLALVGVTIGLASTTGPLVILIAVGLIITFILSLTMWGLRFLSFGLFMNDKAKKKLSKAIFEDVKTIQWLDDILLGFLDRNSNCIPLLKEAFDEE